MKNKTNAKSGILDFLTTDILIDNNLDEMQKAVAFGIASKLYTITTSILYIISFVGIAIADLNIVNEMSDSIGVFCLINIGVLIISDLILAALISAKGAMSTKVAKMFSSKSTLVFEIISILLFASAMIIRKLSSDHFIYFDFAFVMSEFYMILMTIFSIKNNKLLEKMNAED